MVFDRDQLIESPQVFFFTSAGRVTNRHAIVRTQDAASPCVLSTVAIRRRQL